MFDKLKSIMKTLGLRGEDPLKTRQELINFIDGRAAFVSQVTLYTYVKARAGTQYPKLFENADFLTSLKIARWHIYGAAVCDLTLFAAAQLRVHGVILLIVHIFLDKSQVLQTSQYLVNLLN